VLRKAVELAVILEAALNCCPTFSQMAFSLLSPKNEKRIPPFALATEDTLAATAVVLAAALVVTVPAVRTALDAVAGTLPPLAEVDCCTLTLAAVAVLTAPPPQAASDNAPASPAKQISARRRDIPLGFSAPRSVDAC
jgi:hypothetical protein